MRGVAPSTADGMARLGMTAAVRWMIPPRTHLVIREQQPRAGVAESVFTVKYGSP